MSGNGSKRSYSDWLGSDEEDFVQTPKRTNKLTRKRQAVQPQFVSVGTNTLPETNPLPLKKRNTQGWPVNEVQPIRAQTSAHRFNRRAIPGWEDSTSDETFDYLRFLTPAQRFNRRVIPGREDSTFDETFDHTDQSVIITNVIPPQYPTRASSPTVPAAPPPSPLGESTLLDHTVQDSDWQSSGESVIIVDPITETLHQTLREPTPPSVPTAHTISPSPQTISPIAQSTQQNHADEVGEEDTLETSAAWEHELTAHEEDDNAARVEDTVAGQPEITDSLLPAPSLINQLDLDNFLDSSTEDIHITAFNGIDDLFASIQRTEEEYEQQQQQIQQQQENHSEEPNNEVDSETDSEMSQTEMANIDDNENTNEISTGTVINHNNRTKHRNATPLYKEVEVYTVTT
ncbi:hypothetical protein WMY93_018710 [Mugilogobius chulae]|uniref:Uncharacterized protein n=1 Tax=Mugilogobius chulae TaxID=88201 RepID=A0AAW0NK45_9GOBI